MEGPRLRCWPPVAAPPPPPSAPIALVVDDVPHVRALLGTLAKRRGFEVLEAGDGEAAVRLAAERSPHLILLDLRLPRLSGLEALAQIREHDPQVAVVIVAAVPDRADCSVRSTWVPWTSCASPSTRPRWSSCSTGSSEP